MRLRVGMLAVAVAVSGCVMTPGSSATVPPASVATATNMAASTPRAFASPWLTARVPWATLAVAHVQWGDTGGPVRTVAIYDDGTVVETSRDGAGWGVLLERRITTAAVGWIREQLQQSGLFTEDRTLPRTLLPGATACPCGGAGDGIELTVGDRTVTVGRNLVQADTYAPSAEVELLESLIGHIDRPDGWLPSDAWVVAEAVTYRPPAYQVAVSRAQRMDEGYRPPVDVDTVPWPIPLAGGLDRMDAQAELMVDAAIAYALDAVLPLGVAPDGSREPSLGEGPAARAFSLDWEAENATIYGSILPLLPDGKPA